MDKNLSFSIEDKVFVVCGGGGTVGIRLCRYLATAGAIVIALDIRSQDEVSKAFDGLPIHYYRCDLGVESEVQEIAMRIDHDLGKVDALVNLVCTFGDGKKATETAYRRFENDVHINVGTYYICSTVFASLLSKTRGVIINFASTASYFYIKGSYKTSYCVAKSAILMLTKALAFEFAELGIRVNGIAPGFIDIRENLLDGKQEAPYSPRELDRIARIPLGRMATIEDLLGPIIFLASDASSYITGHTIVVDGGFLVAV